jgi:HK97 family phage portal protein
MGLFTRSIRPPDDIVPNANDPASVPPSTVGPDQLVTPGDPDGVVVTGDDPPDWVPPRIRPSAWSGWPEEWWTPNWGSSSLQTLTDIAWLCIDRNASLLSTFPPYLKDAAPTLSTSWLNNPNPDLYTSWEEFAKQLFWDYQAVGEVFVIVDSRYATGLPALFHVVPPWAVNVEMDGGRRRYAIGSTDYTDDMLQIRYQSTVADAHGHGPLEAGQARIVAQRVLLQYATTLVTGGGVPTGILKTDTELQPAQAAKIKQDWVTARMNSIGEPAVLDVGLSYQPIQANPKDLALVELAQLNESMIARLLGVPPALVGLPSGGDPMTYSNVTMYFDQHWRWGLSPMAQTVMAALSQWVFSQPGLPQRSKAKVELNRDEYVRSEPLQRAQTYQILASIVDPATGRPAMTVDEIRAAERFDNSTPQDISSGVLQ